MLTTKKGVRAVDIPLLICCAALLLSGCKEPGPKALLEGERLLKERQYADAIKEFQEAVQLMPQNAQAWNHLGLAYHYSGQPNKAVEAYQHALQVDRNLAAARHNLGQLYFQQHQYGAAASELTTFVTFQPKSPEAWVKLATAQQRHAASLAGAEKSRWLDAARSNFELALQFGQLPSIYNSLGTVEVQRGKPRESVRYFNLALQKQPNYAPAILNLAVVHHVYLNDKRAALQRYREFLAYQPRSSNMREIEAAARQIEMEINPQPVQQRQYVTNIVAQVLAPTPAPTQTPTPAPAPAPAAAATPNPATQTPTAAAPTAPRTTLAQTAPTASPRTPTPAPKTPAPAPRESAPAPRSLPPPVEAAIVQEQAPVQAARDVEEKPAPAPQPAASPTAEASREVASTTQAPPPEDAADKPGMLKRLNPKRWFGDKEETPAPPKTQTVASSTPRKVTTLPPPREYPRYRYLSPARPKAGNRSEAVRLFNEGLGLQRQGQNAKALDLYRRATKADASFFEAHYNLGLLALEQNAVAEALAAYETALAISPDSTNARYNLAFSLQKGNYATDAASEFEKLLTRSPRDSRVHLSLANLYSQQLGRPDRARAHYQKVLELEPNHPQAVAIRLWLRDNS